MKRFDKGYVYSALLSDLFVSVFLSFVFFQEIFLNENASAEDMLVALPLFAVASGLIYLCLIVYRILYYRTSGYELTETEIRCNRGVLFRKRSVLDYKNVHAINKKQSLIHRIFGIAVLTVDSGSANTAHQAEITIVERAKTVDALMNELNSLKENGTREPPQAADGGEVLLSEKDSLYHFTSKKKLLYTVISLASTAFVTVMLFVFAILILGACRLILQLDLFGAWGELLLGTVFVGAGAMLLSAAISFLGCLIHSFVGYYDFTITKKDNAIQISYGLLERHTNTFSYDRIKAVKISQGLVQRMLGFASIKLEVIGYTSESSNGKGTELGVLVPFCRYCEINEILGRILPEYIPDPKQTRAVSFFPFVSWFSLTVGIVTGIALAVSLLMMTLLNAPAFAISATVFSIVCVALTVLVLKLGSALLAYQTNGLAIENGKITAYSGGYTKSVTVFLAKNLVAVEKVTTPLRKKHGIESLVMHLRTNATSNEVKVQMQKKELSEELEKLLRS